MTRWFSQFATAASQRAGRPATFLAALAVVVGWAVCGPIFGFTDTWQLIINTGTTIITFLMVFLIQNTQNRDGQALQLKLDELIRSISNAKDAMLDLEDLDPDALERVRAEYQNLASIARLKETGSADGDPGGHRLPAAAAQASPSPNGAASESRG
jgi:low affinity Fe/Cu permease